MSCGPILKVVVAGGGITALTAAATLKRRIPLLDVQLVRTPPAADTLADQIISTLPSICGFHERIGLAEADTIKRAASGIRLGMMIEGFAAAEPDFVHAYDRCGVPLSGVAFHQLWLRETLSRKVPPFDRFSAAGERARAGNLSGFDDEPAAFGLQLDLERYGEMMRAYAHHLGVGVRSSLVRDVVLRATDGFIEKIVLEDGEAISADLFVDCTGPAALLHEKMESLFVDWAPWLPCDRVALKQTDPDPAAELMDHVAAVPFGWRWRASSPQKGSVGIVYSSRYAGAELDPELAELRQFSIRQGRKGQFWIRNCVAIGDAAVTIEPLQWTNLHLVHSQLDRIVAMMPGRDCAAVEVAQFNREATAEADRARDFLSLHYICSSRSDEFWKDAASMEPPVSLEHTLALFKERGSLPIYPEECFSRDSWLTILLGVGIRPRRIDPLAALVPGNEAAQAFASMSNSLKSFRLSAGSPIPDLNPHGIR